MFLTLQARLRAQSSCKYLVFPNDCYFAEKLKATSEII